MPKRNRLRVKSVVQGSLGQKAGIQEGDELVELNGHPVRDLIDFQFHTADESVDLLIKRSEETFHVNFPDTSCQPLGLNFEPMQFCACGNHCIFCFVDQNPKGMRDTIYFKDEDYRLSFLFGNYVTLTRVNQDDLDRIVRQRLSPLYVSIHAVQPQIRKDLLGIKKDDHLLEKIDFLIKNQIELHGQMVLCPGINDGKNLEESIERLAEFTPRLRSISLVPVGLTKHRGNLPHLDFFDADRSKDLIRQVRPWQKKFEEFLGEPFIYLADELYIRAGESLPEADHYKDFWQIDNGVGMMRLFLDDARHASSTFPKRLKEKRKWVWISGISAGPILRDEVVPLFQRVENLNMEVHEVHNQFYGKTVTVTGLLTGQDIVASCKDIPNDRILMIPPNCLNHENRFLDNMSVDQVSDSIPNRIFVFQGWETLWQNL